MSCEYTKCTIEVPSKFCDELSATMTVEVEEFPSHAPASIIKCDQEYVVRVCVELGSSIKKLLCGYWCICIAVEGIGEAREFKLCQTIPMNNCDPKPDCYEFRIKGSDFFLPGTCDPTSCGDVFYLVATVVGLDPCEKKPIGIAGFCKVGPVMVF
jgi:hypothetical protein